jgi:hypothetical protein
MAKKPSRRTAETPPAVVTSQDPPIVADLAEPMPPPQTGIIDLSGGSPATGPVMLSPDPPIPEELQPFAPGSKFAPEPGPAQPFPNLTQPAAPPVSDYEAMLRVHQPEQAVASESRVKQFEALSTGKSLGLQMPPMEGSSQAEPALMDTPANDPTGLVDASKFVSALMAMPGGPTPIDSTCQRYWRLHLACPTPVQFNPYYLPIGETAPTEVAARKRFWDDNGLGGSMHELTCVTVDYIPDSHSDKVGK